MCKKKLTMRIRMLLLAGALSGLAGCGSVPSEAVLEEQAAVPEADDVKAEYDVERQEQKTEKGFGAEEQNAGTEPEGNEEERVSQNEVEIVNAAEFGNPKEVLENMPITSNVEVKKTEEDELEIEFELENVGLCTFSAGKEKEAVLPEEVFIDSAKIEWTALTADGDYIFPYMRVNESGDMFMIDWTYNGYSFAIYGKSPQNTNDRDMAGKIALAIIYNLDGTE